MRSNYSKNDLKVLHDICVDRAKMIASNGADNYILVSGGIDSMTALYSFVDARVEFTAVNFAFEGIESKDRERILRLEKASGIKVTKLDFSTDLQANWGDIVESVNVCLEIFGKVRKVKCETIYAYMQTMKAIPKGSNVITGMGGGALSADSRKAAETVNLYGENDPDSIWARALEPEYDEANRLFSEPDYHYFDIFQGEVKDYLLTFTTKAINKRFPKSMYAYAFYDLHANNQSYVRPQSFQKACGEDILFDRFAKEKGFKNALDMFNRIGREIL